MYGGDPQSHAPFSLPPGEAGLCVHYTTLRSAAMEPLPKRRKVDVPPPGETASLPAPTIDDDRASPTDGERCTICLAGSSGGRLVQRGCCCRGDAAVVYGNFDIILDHL